MIPRPAAALAATLALVAGPALAASEPSPAGHVSTPEPDTRDARMRVVEHQRGQIIRLIASKGRALMVELPAPLDINSVLTSDQDVIDGTVPEDDPPGHRPQERAAPERGVAGQDTGVRPCIVTANLQVCIRRDRFLAIKPLTELDPQPIHVIALRPRPDAEPEEVAFLFEIETLGRTAPVRTASAEGPTSVPAPYYMVRVNMPAPPVHHPAPRPAARRAVAPPPPPPPVATPEPPPINRAYGVQGDASLVGAAR